MTAETEKLDRRIVSCAPGCQGQELQLLSGEGGGLYQIQLATLKQESDAQDVLTEEINRLRRFREFDSVLVQEASKRQLSVREYRKHELFAWYTKLHVPGFSGRHAPGIIVDTTPVVHRIG